MEITLIGEWLLSSELSALLKISNAGLWNLTLVFCYGGGGDKIPLILAFLWFKLLLFAWVLFYLGPFYDIFLLSLFILCVYFNGDKLVLIYVPFSALFPSFLLCNIEFKKLTGTSEFLFDILFCIPNYICRLCAY